MMLLVAAGLAGLVVAALAVSGIMAGQSSPPRVVPTVDEALRAEARALCDRGRAIDAIKLVRTRTGLGLREAKDVVDSLQAR